MNSNAAGLMALKNDEVTPETHKRTCEVMISIRRALLHVGRTWSLPISETTAVAISAHTFSHSLKEISCLKLCVLIHFPLLWHEKFPSSGPLYCVCVCVCARLCVCAHVSCVCAVLSVEGTQPRSMRHPGLPLPWLL